jgi:hypothetical protein
MHANPQLRAFVVEVFQPAPVRLWFVDASRHYASYEEGTVTVTSRLGWLDQEQPFSNWNESFPDEDEW